VMSPISLQLMQKKLIKLLIIHQRINYKYEMIDFV